MEFLKAVIEISKRKDLYLCNDERETTGMLSSICVFKTFSSNALDEPQEKSDEFIGKLHWPNIGPTVDGVQMLTGQPATVDESVEWELASNEERLEKELDRMRLALIQVKGDIMQDQFRHSERGKKYIKVIKEALRDNETNSH